MSAAQWIERMRDVDVPSVARRLGHEVKEAGSSWTVGPCPSCGAKVRGKDPRGRGTERRDNRGAVGVSKRNLGGWQCHQCGETGDAAHFVALSLLGAKLGVLGASESGEVREWCEAFLGITGGGPAYVPPPAEPEGPRYPDADELAELWSRARPVVDDPQVATFLERTRAIDPAAVALEDLARALPEDEPGFPWAGFRSGRTWGSSGFRLLVPLFDAAGVHRSVIARRVRAGSATAPKGVSPSGFERSGLLMADAGARAVLEGGSAYVQALGPLPRLVVTEGEIDYLTVATEPARGEAYGSFGVVQGSWTAAVADRVPDGARLVLALDADDAGEELARRVFEPLEARARAGKIRIERWRPA